MADYLNADDVRNAATNGWPVLRKKIVQEKIPFTQWIIRSLTIFFSLMYIIPILG